MDLLRRSLPARNGLGGYAEHYGRAMHFLWRAGHVMDRRDWRQLAINARDEALAVLGKGERLSSHPWEARVDGVDGMGWLILALLEMDGFAADMDGLFW